VGCGEGASKSHPISAQAQQLQQQLHTTTTTGTTTTMWNGTGLKTRSAVAAATLAFIFSLSLFIFCSLVAWRASEIALLQTFPLMNFCVECAWLRKGVREGEGKVRRVERGWSIDWLSDWLKLPNRYFSCLSITTLIDRRTVESFTVTLLQRLQLRSKSFLELATKIY